MKCIQANKESGIRFRILWKGLIALFAIFIIASCTAKQFDSEEELWAYLKNPENGYHQTKVVGNIKYELTYRPTDILVKQELAENPSIVTVDSLRNIYGKYLYFNLSMSYNGQELLNSKSKDRNAFGTMVNQLAFGMEQKLNLITQKRDTVPLVDYIYPRMYGMTRSTSMLLAYPREPSLLAQDYCRFTIEDLGFGTGEVGFRIMTKVLNDEPKLSL